MKNPLVGLLFLAGTGVVLAEEQSPVPGPEVKALGYYVGSWDGHGESRGGPFGPPGKLSSKSDCSWFSGGFQIVCRGAESGPTGSQEFLNIKSFDQAAKTYSEYSITNHGESEDARGGTLVGNKLTYIRELGAGEGAVTIRYSEDHVATDHYTYKAEASTHGGPWKLIAEGEIRKVK